MISIGEVSKQTGLSARTIRYYEEVGLLPGVRRRTAGRRVYGPDELERLSFIQRLKTLGLSLAEIKELNAVYAIGGSTTAMLARLDDLLAAHLTDLDRRIAELTGLRADMGRYREHVDGRVESLAGPNAETSSTDETDERPPIRAAGGERE
jgi:DNA-binding transcriptional MerR regulator